MKLIDEGHFALKYVGLGGTWAIVWVDEDGEGGILGQSSKDGRGKEPKNRLAWEWWKASSIFLEHGAERDESQQAYVHTSRSAAARALQAINKALAEGREAMAGKKVAAGKETKPATSKPDIYYHTKYALTGPIFVVRIPKDRIEKKSGYWSGRYGNSYFMGKMGRDTFATKQEAEAAVQEATKKRIASLRRQIKQLEDGSKKPRYEDKT